MGMTSAPAVAMLGGTFDPVHFGHLRCAWELKQGLGLDAVHLVPCARPTHRQTPLGPAEHRLAMLQLAVEHCPGLVADDRELRRQGPSYSIDTVASLRREWGPGACLIMALGADAFNRFSTWHRWQEFLDYCHILVMTRPGSALATTGPEAEWLQCHQVGDLMTLKSRSCGGILARAVTALDIAATTIRQEIRMGGEPRFLMPDTVWAYIQAHGLYDLPTHVTR